MQIQQVKHWTDKAEAGLSQVLHSDKDILKKQIEQGIAQLWYLPDFNSWMISRVEVDFIENKKRKTLVICCYQGKSLNTVGKAIVKAAQAQGFDGIRYHTKRQGLNRLLKHFAFEYQESVFYKSLHTITHTQENT